MILSPLTSHASANFFLKVLGSFSSLRAMIIWGVIPIRRSSWTECCVGLLLCSPAALINGMRVTWMKNVPSTSSSCFIVRIASINGNPSMSPTVPPSSTTKISCPSPAFLIRSTISPTIWGTTWMVWPKYPPLRSRSMTLL